MVKIRVAILADLSSFCGFGMLDEDFFLTCGFADFCGFLKIETNLSDLTL